MKISSGEGADGGRTSKGVKNNTTKTTMKGMGGYSSSHPIMGYREHHKIICRVPQKTRNSPGQQIILVHT